MIMIVFVVISVCLICLWLKFLWDQRKYYALAKKLEGPPAYPIIGCMLSFLGNIEDNFTKLFEMANSYQSPIRVWVGPKLYLYVDRPEHVQTILNSPNCLEKEKVYKFLVALGGDGLITSEGAKWKYHRKLMNPSFATKRLIGFMDTFNEASKILSDRLENIVIEKKSVDIFNYLSDCTLDIVCKAAMGVKNLQVSDYEEYLNATVKGFELACYRIFNFWLHPQFIYRWTKVFKKQEKNSNIMYSFTRNILKGRKEELDKDDKLRASLLNETNDDDECTKTPQIFIYQLLKLAMQGYNFSDEDIVGELSTIILAANETSASAVAYTVLALSFNPEIQERVFNEINDVFPTRDCKVEYEDLSKLNYLEMVLKETMRLYTIVPMIGRRTSADCKVGDLTIPGGVGIAIGCYLLHRHKDIWGDDAEEYNPDHFLPEVTEKRHPYSYIPFGGGPRNCIGQKYAMLSMKTMMVYLLRKYRFTTKLKPEELKFEIKVSLKLANKHMVEVHRREY